MRFIVAFLVVVVAVVGVVGVVIVPNVVWCLIGGVALVRGVGIFFRLVVVLVVGMTVVVAVILVVVVVMASIVGIILLDPVSWVVAVVGVIIMMFVACVFPSDVATMVFLVFRRCVEGGGCLGGGIHRGGRSGCGCTGGDYGIECRCRHARG